jgi:hydrogenase/urease accessory protein HupE
VARDRVKPLHIGARARAAGRGLVLASCAPQAHAHLVETGLGPVYDGIAHFALTPEDLIPALALAVLAGLRGREHARRVIFVLPVAWLLAGILGTAARVPVPDSLSWVPLLVLGGLVAADFRLPAAATTAIAAALGLFLGLANGYAMAQAGSGVRGVVGIVGAVFVVTTLGAACAAAWQSGWLRIAWRVAGSWIAASALLLLGWSLR